MVKRPYQRVCIAFALAAVVALSGLWGCGQAPQQSASTGADSSMADSAASSASVSAGGEVDFATTFPSWNPKSESLAKLVSFVQGVTKEGSDTYVAPEERIATFDMDGTILCEKAPVYMDYCLLMHRVLDDPDYEAPAAYVETCKKIRENADKGVVADDLDAAKNEALTGSFAGVEPDELHAYVENFLNTVKAEGFDGMTYGESFYKPMAEVVNYLEANDFNVYIVSASEREIVRAAVTSRFGIAPDHIIGTDWGVKATGQTDEESNKYTYAQDDDLVFDGDKYEEVAKLNKVVYIEREIGSRPLLAFGNSSGDYAMLNYAQSNPDHAGMGLLVLCDDVDREYGDTKRATEQSEEASKQGWTTFSMANDWATIYGEGVTKTALAADAKLDAAA